MYVKNKSSNAVRRDAKQIYISQLYSRGKERRHSSKVPRARSGRGIFDSLLLQRRLMSAMQSRREVKRD